MTDVYGYMLGTVDDKGDVSFTFRKVNMDDVLISNEGRYPEPLVRWCFDENKQFEAPR
jgi:hypothetical protein